MPLTGYISEAVAGGALICLWVGIRGHRKEMIQAITAHKAKVEAVTDRAFAEIMKVEEKSMTNKDHAHICKINTLEITAHISNEIKTLGEMLTAKIDTFKNEIERLDRRTRHLKDAD